MRDLDGLPSIEDLTGQDGPERGQDELSARVRAYMGEADPPAARRDPGALDTTALRQELGL